MSLWDLLSSEGRRERALEKNCAKAQNGKIKPDDRRPALYDLYEEAVAIHAAEEAVAKDPDNALLQTALQAQRLRSERAITGLLSRFTFIYDTNIVMDEEEKEGVYEWLVGMGERILPHVRRHLHTAPSLSWGLRIITDICDHETTWDVLAEVLKKFDPEYERDPSRKIQLMTFLGEFKDPRAVQALLPFLGDHDETVRYVTVESLLKQGDEEAREPLLQLLVSEEEESLRIKARIVEGICDAGWRTKGFRGTVEKLLLTALPEYIVDGKGHIKRKKPREEPPA